MLLSLQELKNAVNRLSASERDELRAYLEEEVSTSHQVMQSGTMDVDALLIAAQEIRESMSPQDFETMLDAMNEEFIEITDEDEWEQ
jgi:hypothetical protein